MTFLDRNLGAGRHRRPSPEVAQRIESHPGIRRTASGFRVTTPEGQRLRVSPARPDIALLLAGKVTSKPKAAAPTRVAGAGMAQARPTAAPRRPAAPPVARPCLERARAALARASVVLSR